MAGLVLMAFFCLLAYQFVSAQVVNITATVPAPPDTIVSFSGIAYPNAPVTILQNGASFLSTTANAQGDFSVAKNNATAGTYTYTLSATDAQGRSGPSINIITTVASQTTTSVSNIFFGPTIVLSDSSISVGDSVTLSGITSPSSSVAIYVAKNTTTTYTVTANSSGAWTKTFSSELTEGTYSIRARATDPDTSVSQYSTTVTLTVGAPSDPCLSVNHADVNCDGDVDLTDLSTLLSYWRQTNPGNPRVDINADTKVDLYDFSIMMYNWTGPV